MSAMDLPRRNGQSVLEALRGQDVKLAEQQLRIDGLNQTVATLLLRVHQVEQFVAIQKVVNMGTGPTVRG